MTSAGGIDRAEAERAVSGVSHADAKLAARIHRSIFEISPEEWNQVSDPDDVQARHKFIAACERGQIEDARYWYLIFERDREIEAVAVLSSMQVSLELLAGTGIRRLVGFVRGVVPGFMRVRMLFCGLPVSFGQSCLRMRANADAHAVCESLAATMEIVAKQEGAGLLCAKEFTPAEIDKIDSLRNMGFLRALSLPFCSLDLPWRSLDGYAESLRAPYRRQLRSTLGAGEAAGLSVRVLDDPWSTMGEFHSLYDQVMSRAEHRMEYLPAEFLRHLCENLRGSVSAVLVQQDRRVVAAALLIHEDQVSTFLLAGLDYDQNLQRVTYPYLVVQVLEESLRRGCRRLDLGQTSYALKTRLGAGAERRYLYLRHRSRFMDGILRRAATSLFPDTHVPGRRVFRQSGPPPCRA